MEVGGLGDLIPCDDHYNSTLCIHWSRVYQTLSYIATVLQLLQPPVIGQLPP